MADSEIAALLRALLEQFRDDADEADPALHPGVAAGLPQTAAEEGASPDESRQPGRQPPRPAPTMWRQ
jgi:hypothetical protein